MSSFFKNSCVIILVLAVLLIQEGEARRKILKGRKAITRNYYRNTAIPGWAILILVAVGEMVIGGLLYILLKVLILDKPIKPRYVQAPSAPATP